MICFQLGATLVKGLFPIVGAGGAAALRLAIGSVILLAAWRPWPIRFTRTQLLPSRLRHRHGLHEFLFYLSLRHIPLGIAVALEFSGPLTLALFASRRAVDFLWILLAVLGLAALLPLGLGAEPLSLFGSACALGAGLFWALYIVFGRKAGAAHGSQITAWGTVIGALVIVPVGLAGQRPAAFLLAVLPVAIAVAILSSALPYSLEMFAMPRLPTRTFGVMMSLDPALAAVAGLIFLGETLTLFNGLPSRASWRLPPAVPRRAIYCPISAIAR